MNSKSFAKLFDFLPKSKQKAGMGLSEGTYPFYTSSNELTKYTEDCDYAGNCLIFGTGGKPSVHYQISKFATSTDCIVARPKNKTEINAKYSYLYFRSTMRILEAGFHGAGLKHISKDYISKIQIPLPPLDDQIRIATILTRAEALIAKRKESIKLLDEFLKSTFLEMFGDPVINEKGWDILPMNKIGSFISGGTPSKVRSDFWEGDFPWVSPKDMKYSYIIKTQDFISQKVFEETNLKKIASGNLLIVVRGMILAHTFPTAINTVEVSINQDMKAILPISKVLVLFLKRCLDSMERQILSAITTAGHGTKKLDTDVMGKLFIPIPPLPLQTQFASIVKKIESIKFRYQQSLTELENLYGSLSQRAFKGELDLSKVSLEIDVNDQVDIKEELVDTIIEKLTPTNRYSKKELENIIRSLSGMHFTFEVLMTEIEKASFENMPSYDEIRDQIFDMLEGDKPFLLQTLINVEKDKDKEAKSEIMLSLNQ